MEPIPPAFPRPDKLRREILRLAINPPVVFKGKKQRALEAKDHERRQKKVGTVITATKHTLLQARQLRDELASDPRFMERDSRKLRSLFSQTMPWNIRQAIFQKIVDDALVGTPEGDIPDDWESSLVVLPENCLDEVFEEIRALVGPEQVEEARAMLRRCLDSEGEDEDEDDGDDEDEEDEEMKEEDEESV